MKNHFKEHLIKIKRFQTSENRDLVNGLRLDRNERVVNFLPKVIKEIFANYPDYAFSVYPNCQKFTEKLAQWHNRKKEELYIFNGVTEGIRIVFETLLEPNDNVLILSPTYPMYSVYMNIFQTHQIPINLMDFHKNSMATDMNALFEFICSSINSSIKMLILPNPNVPIETNFSLSQLLEIADCCKKTDVILLIDEAYCFWGSESAVPLIDDFDNIIVMQSCSKAFGLAGIRLGYMFSKEENINYLSKTRSITETDAFSMIAAEYILDNDWITKDYVLDVKKGAEFAKDELSKLNFEIIGGDVSNAILLFPPDNIDLNKLYGFLIAKKVYTRKGFMPPYENCLRVTLGPLDEMRNFLEVIKLYLHGKN